MISFKKSNRTGQSSKMLSKFKSNAGISWGTYKTISLQRSRKTWLYERDITWYYIEQMVPYHCPSLRWRKRIIAGGDKKTRLRSKNARARERRPLKQLFSSQGTPPPEMASSSCALLMAFKGSKGTFFNFGKSLTLSNYFLS